MIFEMYTAYPPSVNNYYVKTQRGVFISHKGRKFRDQFLADSHDQLAGMEKITQRVRLEIVMFVPDNRKRDQDNILKAIQDSMMHAGLIEDDSLIDQTFVYRGEKVAPNGLLYIRVSEAAPCIPKGMEHLLDSGE